MANNRKSREPTAITPHKGLREELIATYCRVSSDSQAKEMTIEVQESAVRDLYERLYVDSKSNHTIVGRFKDEAYNLEVYEPSRNFWRLIELIEAKKVNVLIVVSADRIFRGESAAIRGRITDALRRNRVKLITAGGVQVYDPSETASRVAESVTQELGAVAKLEAVRTMHSARRQRLEERGAWGLTIVPYGIRLDRTMDGRIKKYSYRIEESEAKYVRDIFRLYVGLPPLVLPSKGIAGRIGATRIAKLLEDAKVDRTAYIASNPIGSCTAGWDKQKVLRIITNETYAGRLIVNFNPTSKVAGHDNIRTLKTIQIPSIVDDDLFAAAQSINVKVRDKLLRTKVPRTEENWLHGLLICPECGDRLTGRLAHNNIRYYGCHNYHGLMRADDAEMIVENRLKTILLNKDNFERLLTLANRRLKSSSDVDRIEKSLEQKTKEHKKAIEKLDNLTEMRLNGEISADTFKRMKDKVEDTIETLDAEISALRNERKGLEAKKVSIKSIVEIRNALESALGNSEKKVNILRATSVSLIEGISVHNDEIEIDNLSKDKIKELYLAGRLVLRDLKAHYGWTAKKVYSEFGQTNRKSRIDYRLEIAFKGVGSVESLARMKVVERNAEM